MCKADSDHDIVLRVLRGERNAFAVIVDRYKGQVFSLAFRMTGSRQDAEDLTQEAFVRAFTGLGRYDCRRPFFTWLYTVSLNVVRNHLDRQRRSPTANADPNPLPEEQPVDPATPESLAAAREETGRVQAALNSLPVDTREALVLRFVHDLPFHDLSQILQVSVSAAKKRVYRGLEQFRGALGE